MHAPGKADLKEVLAYALGGTVPEGFLEHLIRHRHAWDEVLWHRLERYAYELRPDLACWCIAVDEEGRLREERLPLLWPPDGR